MYILEKKKGESIENKKVKGKIQIFVNKCSQNSMKAFN